MDLRLPNGRLQPGMRFSPTHEELAVFYLTRKVLGKKLFNDVITEVDIYRFAPWDLPELACPCFRKELMWHFFCPRSKKYARGERTNRATECGYWKATGNDRVVSYKKRTVAKIKTLIFHEGKPPKGKRTDWVMHEYRLDDQKLADKGVVQDAFVLCKLFHKRGWGPQNGVEYAAPFIEEEWEDIDDHEIAVPNLAVEPDAAAAATVAAYDQKYSAMDNYNVPYLEDSGITASGPQQSMSEKAYSEAVSGVIEHLGLVASPTPLSCYPSTSEKVYSEAVFGVIEQHLGLTAPSPPSSSCYPSKTEQLSSGTPFGGIEQPRSAYSTPAALSYYPSSSEQGCTVADGMGIIDLAPTPASKVDVASTSKVMPTQDCADQSKAVYGDVYEGLKPLFDWDLGLDLDDLDDSLFPLS